MSKNIRICSISAYATLGSRINLSALSISLKEFYRIDNTFDNTRVRKKHGTLESLTSSRTFFNSLSFRLIFRVNDKTHNLHIRIFTTGTVHIAGASDYDCAVQNAFKLVCGLVSVCHMKEYKDIDVIKEPDLFGLRNIRVAMIHSIYHHSKTIDREKTAQSLRKEGRNVRYDPQLHNAVNVRFTSNNGTFLIFKSGKILVTGCKSLDTCSSEIDNLIGDLVC